MTNCHFSSIPDYTLSYLVTKSYIVVSGRQIQRLDVVDLTFAIDYAQDFVYNIKNDVGGTQNV